MPTERYRHVPEDAEEAAPSDVDAAPGDALALAAVSGGLQAIAN
jgi:hypothetical protein